MSHTLFIIASCADRKLSKVGDRLHLGRVPTAPAEARVRKWWQRLLAAPDDTVAAVDLYGGDFWAVVRGLPTLAEGRGFSVSPMVASAGYGLVDFVARLKPYSATFSQDADGVVGPGVVGQERTLVLRTWWSALARCGRPPRHKNPRTIEGVARTWPSSSILIVASPSYVDAMGEDLRRASRAMGDPDRLVIVSRPTGFPSDLERHLVPSQAPLRATLGGSLMSLHARVARDILTKIDVARPLSAASLADYYRVCVKNAPRQVVPDRRPATDREVMTFILRERRLNVDARHTPLLRAFRESGHACEQSRFRRLFEEATL